MVHNFSHLRVAIRVGSYYRRIRFHCYILEVVDAKKPPLRVFFGKMPLEIATKDYESRLAPSNEWQPVAIEAHGA